MDWTGRIGKDCTGQARMVAARTGAAGKARRVQDCIGKVSSGVAGLEDLGWLRSVVNGRGMAGMDGRGVIWR